MDGGVRSRALARSWIFGRRRALPSKTRCSAPEMKFANAASDVETRRRGVWAGLISIHHTPA